MDIYILISVLSVMHSWILFTALSAPLEETPTASTDPQQRPHVRTKRCSCATFMDNECVYFCHLDIIWVNTPERVVSYGLGNAPRKRRAAAAADSMATGSGPRCQCLRQNDAACKNFCRLENNLRHETSTDSAEGKHKPSADTSRIQRMWSRIRATLKTRLLLKKWRVRQRQRARSWDGESTAS